MIATATDPNATTDRAPRASTWLPALDGIRGLAVLAVLAYHAGFGWARGGYLGVDVFFVLSGYLITTQLAAEHAASGRTDLRRFWGRRVRRLLPAQVALVVALVLLLAITHLEDLGDLRGQVVAALTGTTNWYLLVTGQSYFDEVGRPPLLRHLWSLGVEAQFYLLWPLALGLLRRATRGRLARMVAILLAGAALSALYLAHLHGGRADPSAAYYNTGARLTGLLAGAALALVWRPSTLLRAPAARHPRPWDLTGLAGLALLVGLVARLGDRSPFAYPWGLVLAVVGATVLVAVAAHPTAWLARSRGLAHPALVAIGARSYGLYLWHWPVYALTRPGVDISWGRWPTFGLRLVVTAVLTELSLRVVERRWLTGPALPRADRVPGALWRQPRWTSAGGVVATGAVAIAVAALATAPVVADPISQSLVAGQAALAAALDSPAVVSTTTTPPTTSPPTTVAAPTTVATTTTAAAPPPPPPPIGALPPVTAVGDSVMLGAAPGLLDRFGPQIDIDAVVGRRPEETAAVVRSLGEQGRLRPTVLVHIGTNGEVRQRDLEGIVAAAGGRQVVFLTVRMDRSWEGQVNTTLTSVVPSLVGARLADWHEVAVGHLDWFHDDGAHLNQTGASAYADFVARSLAG